MTFRFTRRSVWWALTCSLIVIFGSNMSLTFASQHGTALPAARVKVHYFRFDNNYTDWNLWMWLVASDGSSYDGAQYDFSATSDAFGVVADVSVPPAATQTSATATVGFLVRLGNWQAKDVPQNRFITLSNNTAEVWLISGDPGIYTSLQDAEMSKEPHVVNGYLESVNTLVTKLSQPLTFPYQANNVTVIDRTTGQMLSVTSVESMPGSEQHAQSDLVRVTLAQTPDITHELQVAFRGYRANSVLPRNVLNDERYTFTGDDMGNTYRPEETTFRVWTPTASDVQLLLYNSEAGALTEQIPMHRSDQGSWFVRVKSNLENWFYLYQVTIYGRTQTAVDPYVRAIAVNSTRGMIVDLHKTNPSGWHQDSYVKLANPTDAVVYETHMRDFSVDANSGIVNKGKYLAFTERGTTGPEGVSTGIDSLKRLGVTHIHILPVADFASIDENTPDQYNWGYDPRNYNVPEGAYATTPHGTKRITEYKQMVQSLHHAHLGIIMDVVYNHTFNTQISDFDKLVPQYYYRTDYSGNYTNGSGVGNEVASERPMVQKFIRDSLKYWACNYHVDGFRFDLMALLGTDTMRKISEDLHAINPNVIIYGEPWTGGDSGLPADQLLTKGQQRGLGIAVFNDNVRNGLIGSVFERTAQGFATGASNQEDSIKKAVIGSISNFTAAPSETMNYVTSHDNLTLWDKITASTPGATEEQRIHMDELAQAIVLTSQGVPFMQGGEEFLRTKGGNDNSYNAGDAVNQYDWARKARYLDVFNYYAGMIALRNHHPAFRMRTAEQIQQHLSFLESPNNTVAFQLADNANGDSWKNIVVVYNPNQAETTQNLSPGTWNIVATQGQVNEKGLGQATGSVNVKAISCMVLYQKE